MSTIPLLPPERSHICIALESVLWAQAFAGSGVGTAAALAEAAGATDAGTTDAGATDAGATDAAVLGAVLEVVELQAVTTRTAMIARAGSVRCLLIRSSSNFDQHAGDRSVAAAPRA
jgi:hypothetical protein